MEEEVEVFLIELRQADDEAALTDSHDPSNVGEEGPEEIREILMEPERIQMLVGCRDRAGKVLQRQREQEDARRGGAERGDETGGFIAR